MIYSWLTNIDLLNTGFVVIVVCSWRSDAWSRGKLNQYGKPPLLLKQFKSIWHLLFMFLPCVKRS